MPVQPCTENGQPGYRWGEAGKCYTYPRGNRRARVRARVSAEVQGYAVEKRGYQESQERNGEHSA